jgi:hypothetical protein
MCRIKQAVFAAFLAHVLIVRTVAGGGVPPSESSDRALVVLSSEMPRATMEIPAGILAERPASMTIAVTEITNPANAAFAVFVDYVHSPPAEGGARSTALHPFVPHPPDQVGRFLIRLDAAWTVAPPSDGTGAQVLAFELRPINESDLTGIKVTLGSAQWLDAEGTPLR